MQEQNEMGFARSLFDFQMTHFITMRVIRVLYAISVALIILAGIFIITVSLANGSSTGILSVVFTPMGVFLYIILARLWVEFLANLYRIGDNTQKLVDNLPEA